jgi:hypothetical protein
MPVKELQGIKQQIQGEKRKRRRKTPSKLLLSNKTILHLGGKRGSPLPCRWIILYPEARAVRTGAACTSTGTTPIKLLASGQNTSYFFRF